MWGHAHIVEYVRQLPCVDPTIVSYILLTSFVRIGLTNFALKSLSVEAIEERTTMVAPGEATIRVNHKAMRHIDVKASTLVIVVRLGILDA